MSELNGIILNGEVYEASEDAIFSCVSCDLNELNGRCLCRDLCLQFGQNNIFRYSQELTDKLNEK